MHDVQPKELLECAFDVITPTDSLIADAEVMVVVDELLRAIQSFKDADNTYYFRVNHTSLLRGILLSFGVAESHHAEIYNINREAEVVRYRRFP